MSFEWEWFPKLAEGLPLTLQITFSCIAIGIVLGVLLALGRVYGPRFLRGICIVYIQFFRGTPLLVQLFIVYNGLPNLGITLTALQSGILALGLNTAAYQAEYFRGAIQAVRGGQMLAARSLGMSLPQAIRYAILPQAFRLVLPAWSNEFILMLKYSSIVFTVTLLDLMGKAKRLSARDSRSFEVFLVAALFYLVLVFVATMLLRLLENRVRIPGLGAPSQHR
ncbi:amino acid ABC transporter permease [Candidatus Bipolaricaulota bacterium]|nr:amino acid ABC transporter permease [Candidatus Bipolaricaulota bacterium]TFH10527.1 MAG: amino acid ABC transporter permease [Candidatus Atribacteria bacterium]